MTIELKYCFIDQTEVQYYGKKTYSILFSEDGSVDVLQRLGDHDERVEKFPSQQAFADVHPVQAANVMRWMREHGRKIEEICFPEKKDLVPIKKKCVKCGRVKSILEFPYSNLSLDGTHKECCGCRIKECKEKKMYCTANHISDVDDQNFGGGFLRFEQCKNCPVGSWGEK